MANNLRNAEVSLRVTNDIEQIHSSAKKELALVSPCSHCQNFTQPIALSSDPYRSACPRRTWINQNQANPDNPIDSVLYLSGTDDPNTLVNPVVDQATGNYLIWVAAVDDNQGIQDTNGNVITTGILDPNFNNLYIKCRLFPYVSEQHHDILRNIGAFQENDHVVAEAHRVPAMTTALTNNQVQFAATPVAGTVAKTSFAYFFNTTNPNDHALITGG
jgi:hypothetical protein